MGTPPRPHHINVTGELHDLPHTSPAAALAWPKVGIRNGQDTLLFGTALQTATFAVIAMTHAQPTPGPHVVPPDTIDLDN